MLAPHGGCPASPCRARSIARREPVDTACTAARSFAGHELRHQRLRRISGRRVFRSPHGTPRGGVRCHNGYGSISPRPVRRRRWPPGLGRTGPLDSMPSMPERGGVRDGGRAAARRHGSAPPTLADPARSMTCVLRLGEVRSIPPRRWRGRSISSCSAGSARGSGSSSSSGCCGAIARCSSTGRTSCRWPTSRSTGSRCVATPTASGSASRYVPAAGWRRTTRSCRYALARAPAAPWPMRTRDLGESGRRGVGDRRVERRGTERRDASRHPVVPGQGDDRRARRPAAAVGSRVALVADGAGATAGLDGGGPRRAAGPGAGDARGSIGSGTCSTGRCPAGTPRSNGCSERACSCPCGSSRIRAGGTPIG